jgi:Na+/proline symporter
MGPHNNYGFVAPLTPTTYPERIFGILLTIWIILGILPGIIFLVLYLRRKDKDEKKKYLRRALACFGGIIVFLVSKLLYIVFNNISLFF